MELELHQGAMRAVVATHGGELISLKDRKGTEYIWGGDPAFWSGRNPTLFPVVGSLKNGTVQCGRASYAMGRHGFARNSEFAIEDQGEDFVVFGLRETPETLKQYPFRFSLRIRHQLLENGFRTSFAVENRDETAMPFCIGGHTAFRCPLLKGETFQDYRLVFDQTEEASTLLLTPEGCLRHGGREPLLRNTAELALDRELFDRLDTVIFQGLRSGGVSLLHSQKRHGVRLDFSEFPMVAFWTKGHAQAPFICLEPWHGCAALDNESGQLADKPHCILLQPGEEKRLGYTVTIQEGRDF